MHPSFTHPSTHSIYPSTGILLLPTYLANSTAPASLTAPCDRRTSYCVLSSTETSLFPDPPARIERYFGAASGSTASYRLAQFQYLSCPILAIRPALDRQHPTALLSLRPKRGCSGHSFQNCFCQAGPLCRLRPACPRHPDTQAKKRLVHQALTLPVHFLSGCCAAYLSARPPALPAPFFFLTFVWAYLLFSSNTIPFLFAPRSNYSRSFL